MMRGIARQMLWIGLLVGLMTLVCAQSQIDPISITPQMVCKAEDEIQVVVTSVGDIITLLFEPDLPSSAGEQLVYETLNGKFLYTSPSMLSWMPTCAGWDYIQVSAVDSHGNSRVVARVDFAVDIESQLSAQYDLTVEVEGRGWIVPMSEGGDQYAAIWLNEIAPQERGRRGRGGCLRLPRPSPPPGLNCASMPPEGVWVCNPFYRAEEYCARPYDCEYNERETVVVVCGEAAAKLRARFGLRIGGCKVIGDFELCVGANGCVRITSTTRTRIQCQRCVVVKKQYCRRFCCINGRVECCEQHLYRQRCRYLITWIPRVGPVPSPEVCSPPTGPVTRPGCDW